MTETTTDQIDQDEESPAMNTAVDFLSLCDKAMCSPDFAVTHGLAAGDDVAWLCDRLERHGYAILLSTVANAIRVWDDRPRGVEHVVKGTFRL